MDAHTWHPLLYWIQGLTVSPRPSYLLRMENNPVFVLTSSPRLRVLRGMRDMYTYVRFIKCDESSRENGKHDGKITRSSWKCKITYLISVGKSDEISHVKSRWVGWIVREFKIFVALSLMITKICNFRGNGIFFFWICLFGLFFFYQCSKYWDKNSEIWYSEIEKL